MTFRRLLWRNLQFYALSNFAVALGVAVACAVLTGALLVGDAQRGSLRRRSFSQLAGVEAALVRPRFFRATPDANSFSFQAGIYLTGSIQAMTASGPRRANKVVLLADIDPAPFANAPPMPALPAMPQSLATHLGLRVGDSFTAKIAIPATMPSESLLGARELDKTTLDLTIQLASILDDDCPASQWRLHPGFEPPRNVYLPADLLRRRLAPYFNHLSTQDRPPRLVGHNLIIAQGKASEISDSIRHRLHLDDFDLKWGFHPYFDAVDLYQEARSLSLAEARRRFVPKVAEAMDANHNHVIEPSEYQAWYRHYGYLSLESRTGILESEISQTALRVAREMNIRASATLVYVANEIRAGQRSIPYSLVAAVELGTNEPVGNYLPAGVNGLADDELLLAAWPESPLRDLAVGSTIEVRYFRPELVDGRFVEETAKFRLAGFVPLAGATLDPQLTPTFPGVTDRLSVRDWQPPFPYDNTRMQARDESYWQQYRTIPKAYITLSAGRRLWSSRYGDATSVRLAISHPEAIDGVRQEFEKRLLTSLGETSQAFTFEDRRSRFAQASAGGQDFGLLFLGFSTYLVVAGLVLVAMVSRLNLERRASQIGVLQAVGWPLQHVRSVLLMEGLIVAVLGSGLGLVAAVLYAESMIRLLEQIWPDRQVGQVLQLHLTMLSLTAGFFTTVIVGLGTIFWATTDLARRSTVWLVTGTSQIAEMDTAAAARYRFGPWAILALVVLGILPLVFRETLRDPMVRASVFFLGGLTWLLGLLWLFWHWLTSDRPLERLGRGWWAIVRLGIRNARRHRYRSQLVCGLLAVASFLLVAVESFRRQPDRDFLSPDGGSGGFSLIIETAIPVITGWQNGNAPEILEHLQRAFQRQVDVGTPEERLATARQLLERTHIMSLRQSAGDDASCLNLYQAQRPRMLGVPEAMIQRGGFRFVQSLAATAEERANPWLLLLSRRAPNVVPVIGEQNTVTWMLKKSLGDEWEIPDERGQSVRVRLVAILKDSPFQSELLTSSADFLRLFPGTEGFAYHLIACPTEAVDNVEELLYQGLAPYEPEIIRTEDRVATYMAVENTYLTTFQLLGGIGFILGAFGLAVVVLRSIWERRAELALFQALGYPRRSLTFLVLAENMWLLACGLLIGTLAASAAVLPHALLGGAIPWLRLSVILGLVCLVAGASGWITIRATLQRPLIPALRNE